MIVLITDELDNSSDGLRWNLEPEAGLAAGSDAGRWTLRPTGDSAGVFPFARLTASFELPNLALVTAPGIDNRLRYDPWYRGKKDRFVAGRANPAYLLASWRYAEVFFGIAERNWGPSELEGLLLSDAPYATEQLFLRFGGGGLRLELAAAQLDTITPWDSTTVTERWLIAHRLVVRPSNRLSLSLEESIIYAGMGVPWRYLNPLALGILTLYDMGPQTNSIIATSIDWRVAGRTRLFAQLAIDDLQVDDNTQGDQEPPAYGLTVGAAGGLAGSASWTAWYTRVSNLMYRTLENEEQFTSNGVGIGRNSSDYDQLLGRLTLAPARGMLITGEASLIRQGEGDMRSRYPPVSAFADSLAFLTGVVERTIQLGASAIWTPKAGISLSAYLGYAASRNEAHVAGARDRRVVWRLRGSFRYRLADTLGR